MVANEPTLCFTSRTLVDALRGPDCDERRRYVEELVRIYGDIWRKVSKHIMIKYNAYENATMDAADVVGDEITLSGTDHRFL